MDRIRAGLTGLAVVFLITAAASLLFAPDAAQQARVEAAQASEPGEPLAQLGVAPNSEKMVQAPPAPPQPIDPPPAAAPLSDLGVLYGHPPRTPGLNSQSNQDAPVEI